MVFYPNHSGHYPITSARRVKKFTNLCGATIPLNMQKKLNDLGDDDDATTAYGIEFATEQCSELLKKRRARTTFFIQ
jgi:methylenetetrahydrofolate reductase (NADPH)